MSKFEDRKRPIRIPATMIAEWGPETSEMMKEVILQVVQEQYEERLEWRPLVNMDAIEICRVGHDEQRDAASFARVDFYPGHIIVQHLPGQADRLLRDLLLVVDGMKFPTSGRPAPFFQVAEVSEVKA